MSSDTPPPHDPRADALRAWFLGPRAENAELLERLVVEAVRDHVFWRRNFHPEDGITIREVDKRTEAYDAAVATMTQELMGLLSSLKRGVPFFSGRYKGHMLFEQTLASQIGYFAAMLYNPNNVSVEASPVTTRLELEVAEQLARMVGYDPARSWGHLTSGGTVANFEALWIARNLLYLPVAVAGAAEQLGLALDVTLPGGDTAALNDLGLYELLNVRGADALALHARLWAAAPRDDVRRALTSRTLATAGYQDYTRWLAERWGDPLAPSVVLVPATAHYSWEKILRALGIGSNQLVHVPVDGRFRMDPHALAAYLHELAGRRVPVLACVSVCGTTEESAVDRLDLVLAVRDQLAAERGATFHVHSDACYGGYAASVVRREGGGVRTAAEIRAGTRTDWPSEEWVKAMEALARADSISVDPHKLGYIPYPAGAFLLRDRRARELVSVEPPYLLPTQGLESPEDLFLGRYILEGSKPGAAAAAVWLSHKVVPLDERGYGYLIERTTTGARRLHAALRGEALAPFAAVLAPEPDINIVCYVMTHPSLATLADVNAFNERVYERLSMMSPGAAPEYLITRTRLHSPAYDGAVDELLAALGRDAAEAWEHQGLVVLRSTVMDPFLASTRPGPDHVGGFVAALGRACAAALAG
ncbi:MAG: pyridoxal phosphate-dependent decarboxylase family protein [Gemmatimonadaceae bacterium]